MYTRPAAVARLSTHPAFTATLQQHTETVAHTVVRRASEFAVHCGRSRVGLSDVIQAASSICMACASFDPKTHTCVLLGKARTSRAKRAGGGSSGKYTGYCGGVEQASQCSGGVMRSCMVQRVQSGGRRSRRRRGGSTYSYQGFCGGTPFLSQCAFSEGIASGDDSAVCYGGRNRHHRPTHKQGGVHTPVKSVLMKQYIKTHAYQEFGVRWTANAMHYLDRALQYHLHTVFRETEEAQGASPLQRLKSVLQTYA